MSILVTGAAGFIGSHVAAALLARGERVIGIDNLNDYYSVDLKKARLDRLTGNPNFCFIKADIALRADIETLWPDFQKVSGVVHLAAQAGVRYSLENPYAYIDSNVTGQINILESARKMPNLKHIVYASTSSVYGTNKKMPFSVEDRVDSPMSIYAATKKAGEMMAFSYSHLYNIPATGLRFFTVYGPWGRPDMAAYLFADAIMAGKPIHVFNGGRMKRDFTFVDDIVAGILAALERPAPMNPEIQAPHRVYNLGNNRCEDLMHFIAILEEFLGQKAVKIMEPLQAGDVPETAADIEISRRELGFEPKTPIEIGLPKFVEWYKIYNRIK